MRLSFVATNVFVSFVSLACFVSPASAQAPDAVGVRAQGMGGAFTAVADDATASWWNPAGLAGGAYLNMVLEYGEADESPTPDRAFHRGFAIAFPALGLSYYRFPVSEIRTSETTGAAAVGRQDTVTPGVRMLDVSQFGATVGQSIGNHIVIASTLKLLRGGGETQGDLDAGAMVVGGRLRAGLVVRNLREPTLGSGDEALTLRRGARAGVSWSSAANTAYGGATVAFDADLRSVPTAFGDERRVAGGGELWTRKRIVGARAGVSGSVTGERRAAYAGGLSVALRRGVFGEGQVTRGSDQLRKGWSVGLRVTF